MSKFWRLLLFSVGILGSFILRELLVDDLYRKEYNGKRFKFPIFLIILQSLANIFFGITISSISTMFCCFDDEKPKIKEISMEGKSRDKKENKSHGQKHEQQKTWKWTVLALAIPSFFLFLGNFCGHKSLEYINVTTKTVAKSMKPMPILVLGSIMGKKYHPYRYIGIFLLCLGITFFMLELERGGKSPTGSSYYGIFLSILALVFDGFVGVTQDKINQIGKPSPVLFMAGVNLWTLVISLVSFYLSLEPANLWEVLTRNPSVWWYLGCISLANPLGCHFLYLVITEYSSLQASVITTSRKFLTILVNSLWFNVRMTYLQQFGIFLLFLGISLDTHGGLNGGTGGSSENLKKDSSSQSNRNHLQPKEGKQSLE
eukprot:TRINITY_DN3779_c0_g1_i1.p1 TRINITY_DN3779_c0_g1~~TRINITY_DN3779_c0_g1_i1.p1  ORF type:complete len:373 (+),score=69.99 TRINITY_DN3779_c0_g1_i1:160-1278(+)